MAINLPLQTDHLLLRDFVEKDIPAVHCYASDPEVVRYMAWGPNTERDTRDAVKRWLAEQASEPRLSFSLAIVLRAEEHLIGSCSIRVSDQESRAGHIGYCLNRDYWGRGYASEAARALVAFGFGQLGLHRIFATCDTRNLASARVLEKAGMRREGHLREHKRIRGEWRDSYLYAILEHERPPTHEGQMQADRMTRLRREAGERLERLNEEILRRRDGNPLPDGTDFIRAARDSRAPGRQMGSRGGRPPTGS